MNVNVLNPFAYYKKKKETQRLESEKKEWQKRLEVIVSDYKSLGVDTIVDRNAGGEIVRFGIVLPSPQNWMSILIANTIKGQLAQFGEKYRVETYLNLKDSSEINCTCPNCLSEKYENAIVDEDFEEAGRVLNLFNEKYPEMDIEEVLNRQQ